MRRLFHFLWFKHRRKALAVLGVMLLAYWFCLPRPLFPSPTCMVLEDSEANLLGARIAADGQWRFPHNDSIPEKFATAIIEFEDRRFYQHPGIDPVGIGRAIQQNFANRRIVSGGSTISMQVMRLARPGKPRSLFQKIQEAIMATRLELRYSKDQILAFYTSNAPFGGNVVGLDAASWRYFGKKPNLLSWSEAATLAVLPNSPALIHPGRNRDALFAKRNRLLDRLLASGKIDALTCELAKEEPLPDKPLPLPRLAPHLLDRAYQAYFRGQRGKRTKLRTTINRNRQIQLNQILQNHHRRLRENEVYNLAAIVVEIETGNIIAYAGNVPAGEEHGEQVDVIKAQRSTGSILKPMLYAMMLNEGTILPHSLISDIPTRMSGYQPKNFYETFDGVVPASKAISRSLNVPLVRMLSDYGLEKFHFGLQKLGLKGINRPAQFYGLPLVLGGAEASLEDITNAYVGMSRTLNHFYDFNGRYDHRDFRALNYDYHKSWAPLEEPQLLEEAPLLSAGAIWHTFKAMQEVERPNSEGDWQQFQSSSRVAWKTGTSFGFRDAWAVGITPKYAVGVWVGNADGEGRPGLIGVVAAAPVLFSIFDQLDSPDWFEQPFDEMVRIPVCRKSGDRAQEHCETDSLWVVKSGLNAAPCTFHRLIHTDSSGNWQVHSDCVAPHQMRHLSHFVLPPVEAHYYQSRNPNYQALPPFRPDCQQSLASNKTVSPMQMIYPNHRTRIFVPKDLNGKLSKTVFKVAHRQSDATIFWHLDQEYLGSTRQFHHFELQPDAGEHELTLVDMDGNRLSQRFAIIAKEGE